MMFKIAKNTILKTKTKSVQHKIEISKALIYLQRLDMVKAAAAIVAFPVVHVVPAIPTRLMSAGDIAALNAPDELQ